MHRNGQKKKRALLQKPASSVELHPPIQVVVLKLMVESIAELECSKSEQEGRVDDDVGHWFSFAGFVSDYAWAVPIVTELS